ncbi:hypothetical protein LCGC14_0235940 [marine sediment metagenome]|uniref:Uncharacterized protein n=1 Tax=marine sediment metagenome TaxID=412755 RepID=A0A0F9XD90_9ZZZZ
MMAEATVGQTMEWNPKKGHNFDPDTEDANVLIEVQSPNYVRINSKMLHMTKEEEIDPNGKKTVKWNHETAQMWVPGRVAEELIAIKKDDEMKGLKSMAIILETKTTERKRRSVKDEDAE